MPLLYQKYLNKGSQGAAVDHLIATMGAANAANPDHPLIADGDYGNALGEAVALFQDQNGLEVDGNAGPDFRKAWHAKHGLDLNKVEGTGLTFWAGPDHENLLKHDPSAA